ncbi:helicase associated domain-containing protein, partial [Mycobacterium sp.]|uniref:helicase associated domain-containing protein n=1 Tax=Mycobacterium sp. TaxID=1785 RepID=UPI003C7144C3
MVTETTPRWEFWYGLLLEYVATNDHALVPFNYQVGGHHLGWWAKYQRELRNRGKLSA